MAANRTMPQSTSAPATAPSLGFLNPSGSPALLESLDAFCSIDFTAPQAESGGGIAYAARPHRAGQGGLQAICIQPEAPPRAAAMAALAGLAEPGLLAPLACGPAAGPNGAVGWYVICPAPPGPPLWDGSGVPGQPWSEADLITRVLRPAAAALVALERRRVTHRAIRPNNLFLSAPMGPVVLGEAWSAPPASRQPAVLEPPYVSMCPPSARGEGGIADDVYALGAVLLALFLGRMPMAGLPGTQVILRKLDSGCFQAMTDGVRLPPLLGDLLAAMLADDPQRRPPPALLADPAAARARRVAKRPQRRASQPLLVGETPVWNDRMLAYAMARAPQDGMRLLRLGVADHWVRRALGDATLAARLEDAARHHAADAASGEGAQLALCGAIAHLDPLAPLCWDGLALWPDGLGPLLAGLDPQDPALPRVSAMVAAEASTAWAACRPGQPAPPPPRLDARAQRTLLQDRGWTGGLPRLRYALNPLLACRSKLVQGMAVRLVDVVLAMEATAGAASGPTALPADPELVAFLAARQHGRPGPGLAALGPGTPPEELALTLLRVLAPVQGAGAPPAPHLAAWLARTAGGGWDAWHNRALRALKQQQASAAAASGRLAALLPVFDDTAGRRADEAAYQAALAEAARIDAALRALTDPVSLPGSGMRTLARDVAGAVALALLAVCAVAAAAG